MWQSVLPKQKFWLDGCLGVKPKSYDCTDTWLLQPGEAVCVHFTKLSQLPYE
jgi:hypothetical protein